MTQVAEPGVARSDAATNRTDQPLDRRARRVAGTSGREGPVYDPATGQVARHVDFASAE